jgi:hypothetical protein
MGDYVGDIVDAIKDGASNGKYGRLADYLGDRQVPWLPGVQRMYLASPIRAELYAVDKNGPVLDSTSPTGYKVFGYFTSQLTGSPYKC